MNAIMVAISMIFMISMLSAIWFLDGTPTLVLIEGGAIHLSISSIFIGYLAYTSLQATISIRALRKNLIEGKPIDHHAPWKMHYHLNTIITLLFTLVVGVSAIIPFVQLFTGYTKTLPQASLNLPIIRLANVEDNPAMVREEPYYMSDNVDWGNRYSFDWSPLAPVQYESDEQGVVPGKTWEDGSGEYSPAIHTQFYQLSIPALTDNLVSDLIERYSYRDSNGVFVEKEHPDLDLLIVHKEKEVKEVFASKGNTVIHVRYYGYADLNSVIENIVRCLAPPEV